MSVGDNWWDLPRPAQGIKLYEIREELREQNLHDTEEPPLETATAPPAGAAPNVRTSDGTYNDISCPRMGSAGIRFGRNVPLKRGVPGHGEPDEPEPAARQPRAPHPHDVPAGDDPQRHRRGLDSVHGARLVRAQEGHVEPHPRHPGGRRRQLARAADAGAEDAGGSAQGPQLEDAAGVYQREHALVGRLARLRQQCLGAGVAARRPRGQGAGQPERQARRRPGHGPGDHRLHRERLGGPEPAPCAVRARAQRDLRQAEEAQSAVGRRAAVPAGKAGQRGAAREDSHRRVVGGDPPGRRHRDRPAHELVRPVQQAPERLPEAGGERHLLRHPRLADRAPWRRRSR